MLVNFQTILKDADEKGYAVPAFNVYNMETVMGVIQAAELERSPVIIQFYSRLATTGFVDYLAPVILKAAEKASVPVCMHLDHGAGFEAAAIAVKNGATGIMVDFSALSLEENIANTKKAVDLLVSELESKGVKVALNDLARCDMAEAVEDAFRYGKIVLATTTYNGEIFPFMREFINHLVERNFQNKTVGFIENGSWAPVATRVMKGMLEKCKNLNYLQTEVKILCAMNEQNKLELSAMANELC